MDEGIVERSEDTSHAEDELTCSTKISDPQWYGLSNFARISGRKLLTFTDLRTERDVLGRCALDLLLRRHGDPLLELREWVVSKYGGVRYGKH